ncbi:endonuclease/exonuclease/phosphatase family protein [Planosporangium thailandense]|uniref:Endonuclease/exonuclease/phosphatase family protein n=1 Tax=Planosporangium thailandense TaxID=765197 RepID=A0ABX0XQ78_9ACTN|nr:endonuclease/exonuclease/phosphatase family protein [Planosporangium thailandense]NJC68136.1 endonuclease/exonuclease/phosphatase family protein [Planosporangium thailandense]
MLWVAAGGCAAWAVVRVFGLDRAGGPLVQLIAFTPYVAAGSIVVLGVTAGFRMWWAAGVAAVAAIALVVCVLPRSWADGASTGDGSRLRVLTANMMVGGADARAIVDLVRRHDVQVLALQELTPDAVRALTAAGLPGLLPYRATYPQPGGWGSGLYSRFPLRDAGLRPFSSGFTQATATIEVPDGPAVAVESVHPCAPISPGAAQCWRTDLAGEPPARPDGVVRVLAGDFNATLDHAALRRFIATGYRDAADARGRGLAATWPYDEKWWIPGVTLDHVLADRRVGVAGYDVYRIPRSDHRAVFAELVLP